MILNKLVAVILLQPSPQQQHQ